MEKIGPNIVTDSLQLYLDVGNSKSYPGTGSTWYDLSGNGHNATLYNNLGTTYTDTYKGTLDFNGSNHYARVTDSNNFNPNGGITAICWFRIESFPAFSQYRLINQQESSLRAWGLQYARADYIGGGTSSEIVAFCHSANNITNLNVYTLTKLSINTWYNFAFTNDGTTLKIYLNGILDNSETALSGSPYATIAADIAIGITGQGYNQFWANGKMGLLMFYNKPLTANDILQNYNATKGRYL